MEYDPPDTPYRRAADRMSEAYALIKRQSYREALDILNTAIVIAPNYPLAYALRAIVFDHLGLPEQAEADRQRERQIASTDGYPVADIVDGIATITMRRVGRGEMRRRQPAGGGSLVGVLSPAIFGILMLIGVTAAGAGGVMLALDSINGDNGATVLVPTTAPSPTAAGATQTPDTSTEAPTEDPTDPDVTGSPYSLSSLRRTWENAGLDVTVEGPAEEFEGFSIEATDVSVSGGGQYSVFIYEDAASAGDDWIIGDGSPQPRAGRSFPTSLSVWFNANVIVVVWSDVPGGFDAFLNMTP